MPAMVPVWRFNVCLTREGLHSGEFERIMDRAREYGAAIVQLIKPKPAGGWIDSGYEPLDESDITQMSAVVNHYNFAPSRRDYPPISAQIHEESPEMFGCTAGGVDRFYINAKGDVQPCEFLNLSFGSIREEPFDTIYDRMRSVFHPPGERMLCEAYSPEVARLMKAEQVAALPLDPQRSARVYRAWDRGCRTELYRRIEQDLR
jgi:MoaA/NifB/PqqE/SkfB family radical SAM enzyme